MKTLDISQKLKRDHGTVKRLVADSDTRRLVQIKAQRGRFLPDKNIGLREQLLKCHYKVANRYLKLLVPLESHEH